MNLAHAGIAPKSISPTSMSLSSATPSSKLRLRTGSTLIYFLSFLLTASAAVKFLQIQPMTHQLAALGFDGGKLTLIATLEIVSAFLFAYRLTRPFGLLMVSAYLGGATATHVGHNQLPFQSAIVLALIWLGVWLRHPGILALKTERY